MRVSWERWERMDVLGPVYKMVAQGLNDGEIAKKLGLPEPTVQDCVSWLCHFLETSTRATLGSACERRSTTDTSRRLVQARRLIGAHVVQQSACFL